MNMFKPTSAKDPKEYIEMIEEPRKSEIKKLDELIQKVTGLKPYIETGMLGYGRYHYKSSSGREGDWCLIGLGSQKNYISLYVCATDGKEYLAEKYKKDFPKANIGKSCIRFKKSEDVDLKVLEEVLKAAVELGGMNRIV